MRFNQTLFDEVKNTVFSEIVTAIGDVEQLVPKQFSIGDLYINNVTFDTANVDVSNSQIKIDNTNSGVFLQLPKINRHVVHIDFEYVFCYVIPITFGVDFKLKEF